MRGAFPYADLLAARYVKGGRGPHEFDCWGLARECLLRQGIDVPDAATPEGLAVRNEAIRGAADSGAWPPAPANTPGALVVFAVHPPYVSHLGVVLADGMRFLHIGEGAEQPRVERLDDPHWRDRIAGFHYYSGVAG